VSSLPRQSSNSRELTSVIAGYQLSAVDGERLHVVAVGGGVASQAHRCDAITRQATGTPRRVSTRWLQSPLPKSTQELVSLRVSQINGCGWCVDMHTEEAAAVGEIPLWLNLVAASRHATVFSDAERAALGAPRRGHPARRRPPGRVRRDLGQGTQARRRPVFPRSGDGRVGSGPGGHQ
jgi:AhpD family alkylhydroperoxidase